jgi:hypothetical protein
MGRNKEHNKYMEKLQEVLFNNIGQDVECRGLWCGDFVGRVVTSGPMYATFKHPSLGDIDLPLGEFMQVVPVPTIRKA